MLWLIINFHFFQAIKTVHFAMLNFILLGHILENKTR